MNLYFKGNKVQGTCYLPVATGSEGNRVPVVADLTRCNSVILWGCSDFCYMCKINMTHFPPLHIIPFPVPKLLPRSTGLEEMYFVWLILAPAIGLRMCGICSMPQYPKCGKSWGKREGASVRGLFCQFYGT